MNNSWWFWTKLALATGFSVAGAYLFADCLQEARFLPSPEKQKVLEVLRLCKSDWVLLYRIQKNVDINSVEAFYQIRQISQLYQLSPSDSEIIYRYYAFHNLPVPGIDSSFVHEIMGTA